MTTPIAKTGFILYYNVQCQTENEEDRWQNCTIEITQRNFLMWHSTSKDDDDDFLRGSIQLGPGYEILTEKTGIPGDAPSVPKDNTLKQLFGIMMIELRFVYWFIDTTDGQEWMKLMDSFHTQQSALNPLHVTIAYDGIPFEKSPDTMTDKSSLTQLFKDSSPSIEQCQLPVSTQPLPRVEFLPGKQRTENNNNNTRGEVSANTDIMCIDICCDLLYYIVTFRFCCNSMKSNSHLNDVAGSHHHTSNGGCECCEDDSSCFCCCNECTCECGDCGDCGSCDC